MKKIKLLFLSLILALSMTNCSQKNNTYRNTLGDIFVERVLEKTHGVVLKKDNVNTSYKVMTSVPEYYNEELIILTLAVVCKEYSDVKQLRAWERKGDFITKSYEIGNNHIMSIVYTDKSKLLIFGIAELEK